MRGIQLVKFQSRVKELRLKNHLTQKQFAERIGVQKGIISFYESGERYPSWDVLIRICKTFRVSSDYLLGLESRRYLDVSGLDEEDIAVLRSVADALQRKR